MGEDKFSQKSKEEAKRQYKEQKKQSYWNEKKKGLPRNDTPVCCNIQPINVITETGIETAINLEP